MSAFTQRSGELSVDYARMHDAEEYAFSREEAFPLSKVALSGVTLTLLAVIVLF
ncbi:hypothetical protein [Rubrimonas cliftonensis]|uniref:Uncharacterized protein n=1 Tax=Rubrimonas cliftonensis TaxID=89524 RepID=A0A1H4CUN3_9RHOB|nr:hypothetical protein [Rubrimonas cliftonensis]SEA64009.1 hypothetical protein SAMN05444370_10841 [Rubrimonas cliftonensis]